MSVIDPRRTSTGRCENRLRKLRTQVCCNAQRTLRPPVRDEPIHRNEGNKAPPNGLRRRNSSAQLCHREDQGSGDRGHWAIDDHVNGHHGGKNVMSKFANVVTIEVTPGRRDQVITSLLAHKARLKDEPAPCNSKYCCRMMMIRKSTCTKCTGTPPRSRCISTGRPSHNGKKKPPEWRNFMGCDARSWTSRPTSATDNH